MNKNAELFFQTARHQQVDQVPLVLWDNAVPITRLMKVKAIDYYRNAEIKFRVQLDLINRFSDIRWIPGIWPDYGVITEASAFGCPLKWYEDDTPHAHPVLNNIKEVDQLKPIDPKKSGLMPEALEQYKYFWQNTPEELIEEYGYLEGLAFTMGPMEISAMIRGYNEFPIDLIENPDYCHKLISCVTDGLIEWIYEQQKVNGKIKLLIMPEHYPTQISLEMFEEFVFPYLNKIYSEFADAIIIYHNEGRADHYFARLKDLPIDVFHCGKLDLTRAKEVSQNKVAFLGNLDANSILLRGTQEEVKKAALEKLESMKGHAYILSAAGSMAPGTPAENLLALKEAVDTWNKNKWGP